MKRVWLFLTVFSLLHHSGMAEDWPQFRGPDRDGKSAEAGLMKSWPENGPEQLWLITSLGKGYSSAAISDGIVYVTGMEEKQELVYAFDTEGSLLWKVPYGSVWTGSFPEPRCTPTVEGDRLYVIDGLGRISCLNAKTGKAVWSRDTFTEFEGAYHRWGIAESPLVTGSLVIVTPGGSRAAMVALNKMTGAVVWASEPTGDKSTYCSPVAMTHGDHQIILTLAENHFLGVRADNGNILWKDPYSDYQKKHNPISPNSPLVLNQQIYTTSGYDNGGALFQVNEAGTGISLVWTDSTLDVHHGGVVELDGYIYGSNWLSNNKGNWICLDWKTGKVQWDMAWENKGPVISADGMLYCYDEKNGHLALVKASPGSFQKTSGFIITEGSGPHWAHPAIANGVLYIRHGEALMAFDIQAK